MAHQFKEREQIKIEDFKRRKNLHDKVQRFQNQLKLTQMRNEWLSEEEAFNKFEDRMRQHTRTVSRNEDLIKIMKEKETVFMEKLRQTLDRENALSTK